MCVQSPMCVRVEAKGNSILYQSPPSRFEIESLAESGALYFLLGWLVNESQESTCLFPIHCWGYRHVWAHWPVYECLGFELMFAACCVRLHSFPLLGCLLLVSLGFILMRSPFSLCLVIRPLLYTSVRTLGAADTDVAVQGQSPSGGRACLVPLNRPHMSVTASLPQVMLCDKHPSMSGKEPQRQFTLLPHVCAICTLVPWSPWVESSDGPNVGSMLMGNCPTMLLGCCSCHGMLQWLRHWLVLMSGVH